MASGVVKINAQLKTLALITLKAHIAETHRIIIAVCIVFFWGGGGWGGSGGRICSRSCNSIIPATPRQVTSRTLGISLHLSPRCKLKKRGNNCSFFMPKSFTILHCGGAARASIPLMSVVNNTDFPPSCQKTQRPASLEIIIHQLFISFPKFPNLHRDPRVPTFT